MDENQNNGFGQNMNSNNGFDQNTNSNNSFDQNTNNGFDQNANLNNSFDQNTNLNSGFGQNMNSNDGFDQNQGFGQNPDMNQNMQGYGNDAFQQPPNDQKDGLAIGTLACGIASIVTCCCWGIVGIILGIVAICLAMHYRKTHNGMLDNMTKIGLICGAVGIVLGIISMILSFVFGMAAFLNV